MSFIRFVKLSQNHPNNLKCNFKMFKNIFNFIEDWAYMRIYTVCIINLVWTTLTIYHLIQMYVDINNEFDTIYNS